jgi:hypothetical protein
MAAQCRKDPLVLRNAALIGSATNLLSWLPKLYKVAVTQKFPCLVRAPLWLLGHFLWCARGVLQVLESAARGGRRVW